ncbi:hypothetical protein EAI_14727 [Harpegnathos saltator]|uniref:Uncharacterized protein n=1 Tax=Harpegnathos saltator TaxID=610380 RepID=E2BV89_HARSA|nr:hypothetical protein EAI_14727 [Harpegnathos saltator]
MVKINVRWKLAHDLNLLRGTNYPTKIKYLWRKGWTEIPVIMACTPLSIIASAGIIFVLWYGQTHSLFPKYHKLPRRRGTIAWTRSREAIEDLNGSLTFRTVYVSDSVFQLFLRQRSVYIPEVKFPVSGLTFYLLNVLSVRDPFDPLKHERHETQPKSALCRKNEEFSE